MENSIGRNKVMHTHEIIHQLMHWWDDVVFEKYPAWGKLLNANKNNEIQDRAVNFNRSELEAYFGVQESGVGNYSQGVKYGIGHEVIAKMLAGAEKQSDIKEALASLEPTARRNLHPDQASYLRGKRYNGEKQAHGADRKSEQVKSSYQNDNLKSHERLAAEYKVSPATITRDGQFAEAVDKLASVGIDPQTLIAHADKADVMVKTILAQTLSIMPLERPKTRLHATPRF